MNELVPILKLLGSIQRELACIKMAIEVSNLMNVMDKDKHFFLIKEYERNREEETQKFNTFIKSLWGEENEDY